MHVWRICREPHAADALAGRGGLFTPGRWHSRGRLIVYTSGSLALAALEILVHLDKRTLPSDLVRVEIDMPDDVEVLRLDAGSLPRDWRAYPAPSKLQELGDAWLEASTTAVLRVPSSLIPEEFNFLLNPRHEEARRFTVVSSRSFAYDPRIPGEQKRSYAERRA